MYEGAGPELVAFSDASFAPHGGRSFGCAATAVYGGFVAWRMAKQSVVAMSVAEAELYEIVNAVQQALGVKEWLREINPNAEVVVLVDNTAALGLASEAPGSWKTRHLKVRARYLRQETGRLQLRHVPGEDQAADMGTKPLAAPRLETLKRLWKTTRCSEFLQNLTSSQQVAVKVVQGPGINVAKMLILVVILSLIAGVTSEEHGKDKAPVKAPLAVDGGFELYFLMGIGGLALLAIWEVLKWTLNKFLGTSPDAIARARRLLRIRDQTARALREELAMLEGDQSVAGEHSVTGEATEGGQSSTTNVRNEGSGLWMTETVTAQQVAEQRQYDFHILQTPLIMSKKGDKLHLREGCFGLRNANRHRLRRLEVCSCCLEQYPLYYRLPFNDQPLERTQ